jgi:hypothetical protein
MVSIFFSIKFKIMIEILNETREDLIALRISDEVTKDDYEKISPVIESKSKEFEQIRLYAEIGKMSDIGLGAIWEDLKLDVKHFNDFSRIAVVGPEDWKENLVNISRQLVPADVRYFDATEVLAAKAWIGS